MTLYVKICEKCLEGLQTDSGRHKQWYLEEILKLLISKELFEQMKNDWEEGVVP